MSFKIKIFGSCVSRDILNYQNGQIELVDYHARSSFASALNSDPVQDAYSDGLKSDFQKRMVRADLKKCFFESLDQPKYDFIIIDFIDERFNLFVFDHGGVCTLSNELLNAGFDIAKENGRIILSGSDDFYERWESGWARFLSFTEKINCRKKIIINKVYWAKYTSTGNKFPNFTQNKIIESNNFLDRLYSRVEKDLESWQIIDTNRNHFISAEDPRWGVSPFHYIDSYYAEALGRILTILENKGETTQLTGADSLKNTKNFPIGMHSHYPFERSLLFWQRYSNSDFANDFRISDCRTSGNGIVNVNEQSTKIEFDSEGGTHQVAFILPKSIFANGLAARIRLCNWSSIRYLAFGYTHQTGFRHIKVVNPAQGEWLSVSLVHGDIAYGIQNDWSHPPPAEIADVRIYLRAEPIEGGATVEIEHFICWQEADRLTDARVTCTLPLVLPVQKKVSSDLLNVLYSYLRKCFRHVEVQAEAFMQDGQCPLYGETQLDWQLDQVLPDNLSTVGTYAFSWHSLHPASILMVHAKNTGNDAPVFAAREMVTNWLDRSYYMPDPDKKYAWYDHGTAERQMAFILMWAEGVERGFDQRFMSRLGGAILRHAELLESEQFYASHQPTRYHNHAWFQDLALMASALALPDTPASHRWMRRAIERLSDQLETLIVRDNGFAVFVENSIGYHQGVQRIVELAGDMVRLTGVDSSIPDVAVELSRFSDFFRYPDNRAPAQGDTFRRSNPQGSEVKKLKPYPEPEIVILPKAGYGIVKGNHNGARFMLCMFATSLCRTHKHEDDLSFTLFFDGIEWLIDPSFFSHEYKAPIPAYLRSAAAHNAIFLAGKPYSIDPGSSVLNGTTNSVFFELMGEHHCYPGVSVKRSIKGQSTELSFYFEDEVQSQEGFDIEPRLMLHCGEGVEVMRTKKKLTLKHPDSKYEISISMPSEKISIQKGLLEGQQIRGVTGTTFMQKAEIFSIETSIPCNTPIAWTLLAKNRELF